jgi:hypothetical protein
MKSNCRPSAALLTVAGLLLTASPAAADAQNPACPVQSGTTALPTDDEERALKPKRPVSDDTAATSAAVRAMGPGVGGVSNPQAQALLGQLATFMENEDDADSQAAGALLRERMGGAPGPVAPHTGGLTTYCAR